MKKMNDRVIKFIRMFSIFMMGFVFGGMVFRIVLYFRLGV